jgi:hypothetical protein
MLWVHGAISTMSHLTERPKNPNRNDRSSTPTATSLVQLSTSMRPGSKCEVEKKPVNDMLWVEA